jgi:lipopolysaccharide/colanic/teichoic acid biosynthesis glycosyltransferase
MTNSSHNPAISELNGSPGIPHKFAVRLPKIIGNLIIYILAFSLVFFIKYKHIIIGDAYIRFLIIYFTGWAIGGIVSGKFRFQSVSSILTCINKCYTALLISLGVAAFLLAEYESVSVSRLVVIGSFFSAMLIEIFIYSLNSRSIKGDKKKLKTKRSVTAPVIDLLLLSWVIFFLYDLKIGFSSLNENQLILVSGTYISWFLAAIITHQFNAFTKDTNVWSAVSLQLKFYLLIIALMSIIVYTLQMDQLYRTDYLTAIVIYSGWSFIVMLFLYIDKLPQKTDDVAAKFLKAFEIKNPVQTTQEEVFPYSKYKLFDHSPKNSLLKQRLEFIYFKEYPEVFSFIERQIALDTFEIDKTSILKSIDTYNIKIFPKDYLELFINLHKINDVRRINEYFIEVNNRLCNGGIFIGNFEPLKFRYDRYREKYPFVVANIFYLIDFIWKRAVPKLPVLRKIYFVLTKGQDRALSLAEGLGRLFFCGFEILDLKLIGKECFFVSRKIKAPSEDKNPSFSPIIKMKRVGLNGKPIYVYKLRTMHPYSEYLQKFVYQNNDLQEGGKFNRDFRITKWGAIFRKLWIDELPMITNFIKGDLKIVGVRPISEHYLSLYNNRFRERRIKYKPGLVPPYYVDLPRDLSEIERSEEIYLNEFDNNRIKTDIKYFSKVFINIVFRKARSK